MSPTRLVLFDIDGTLLFGGPLWKECFLGAVNQCFPGIEFPVIPFGGKTDVQIFRELIIQSGFHESEAELMLKKVVDLYITAASQAVLSRAHELQVLPGVREILKELSLRTEVVLGLLTGNVRQGAYAKLKCANLEQYFKFGVFGDDNWDRYKLPALAIERAYKELGYKFSGKQVVIIGDTAHDINCGKSIGVRSIAVGTGRNVVMEELLKHNPDYYFHDLSDTFSVLQAILEE